MPLDRRRFLRLATGLLVATPVLAEPVRRFWPGWRPASPTDGHPFLPEISSQRCGSCFQHYEFHVTSPWGTPWTGHGYTRDGLHFRMEGPAPQDVFIDQEPWGTAWDEHESALDYIQRYDSAAVYIDQVDPVLRMPSRLTFRLPEGAIGARVYAGEPDSNGAPHLVGRVVRQSADGLVTLQLG